MSEKNDKKDKATNSTFSEVDRTNAINWKKNPSRESHMWWQEYSMKKKQDNCPRCEAPEANVNTIERVHMMYGMVMERKCQICTWQWTLRVAEESDD